MIIQLRSIGRAGPDDLAAILPTLSEAQYASYRGPGKLDGSIVNWINTPILQLIGERSGFEVTVATEARDAGFGAVVA